MTILVTGGAGYIGSHACVALPPSPSRHDKVQLVDPGKAQREADIVVFLVGHRPFRRLDPNQFLNKVVVDAIGFMSRPKAGWGFTNDLARYAEGDQLQHERSKNIGHPNHDQ
jgi:nucleoside-diphosphate-sugar epimerase